jgi:hypothetical protein
MQVMEKRAPPLGLAGQTRTDPLDDVGRSTRGWLGPSLRTFG